MNPEHEVPSRFKPGTGDVTPEGIAHLAGNVREHVADFYKPYGSKSAGGTQRVIRGASWAFGAFEAAGFFAGILPRTWPGLMSASVAEEIFKEEGRELNLNMPMIA